MRTTILSLPRFTMSHTCTTDRFLDPTRCLHAARHKLPRDRAQAQAPSRSGLITGRTSAA